jgi:3-hydroxyisobutyrate dehydrogenase-like beta-hydroxyacid dehydrogenase
MTKTAVAFIGLGTMGYPMAGHLQQKGFDVTVYNRSAPADILANEQVKAAYLGESFRL